MKTTTESTAQQRLGTFAYVLGGMSFVPLVGLLFGIACVFWGLTTSKIGGKRLAMIGAGGIAFTLVAYGALFYFGFAQRGGVYDDLRANLARSFVSSLVPSIEFYKIQNGTYPESLKVLQESLPKNSFVSVFDPTIVEIGGQPRYFYYERSGDEHYYLWGLGSDGKPFTADDIVPEIPSAAGSKLGLLVVRN